MDCERALRYVKDGKRSLGRYIHDLNLICGAGGAVSLFGTEKTHYICVIDSERYPQTAEHIRRAQQSGYPSVLRIDREGAAQRRRESLSRVRERADFDRDEYPMAVFSEGGHGADVFPVEGSDNRGAGSYVSWQIRNLPDGATVRIRIV